MNTHKSTPIQEAEWLNAIIEDIEDYCLVSALGGSPFNSQEENDRLIKDAVENGRTQAKQDILAKINELVIEGRLELLNKIKGK